MKKLLVIGMVLCVAGCMSHPPMTAYLGDDKHSMRKLYGTGSDYDDLDRALNQYARRNLCMGDFKVIEEREGSAESILLPSDRVVDRVIRCL